MRVNNLNGQPDGLADAVRSDELPSKNKRCVPRFITYMTQRYGPEHANPAFASAELASASGFRPSTVHSFAR